MDMFEYVAVLTSIILGLGIAHLLQGLGRLIQHPDQDRVYWVHLAWVAYTFLLAIYWWWFEFNLGQVDWTFPVYLFVIAYAVLVYLLCVVAFPLSLAGYDGYKEYFFARRAWFFGLLLLIGLWDIGDTLLKGPEHLEGMGGLNAQWAKAIIWPTVWGIAARVRNERFHAAFVIGMLLLQLYGAIALYQNVG